MGRTTTEPAPVLPRIAAGDSSAFGEAIDRYGPLVWALARRMFRDHAEAEDAVQEVFLELWKSAVRFDSGVASETTFVAMIARRRLIDRLRSVTRGPDREALNPAQTDESAPVASEIERNDEAERAVRAMEELRPEQQRVLRLAIWKGLTHEQIASTTGMPLGTVKTHARRGLQKIREVLERDVRTGQTIGADA